MHGVTAKKAAPKKGRMRRTVIDHHPNGGGHTVKHEYADGNDPNSDRPYMGGPEESQACTKKSTLMSHLKGAIPDDEAAEVPA